METDHEIGKDLTDLVIMSHLFEQVKRNRITTFILVAILSMLILRHSNFIGSLYLNLGFVKLNLTQNAQSSETATVTMFQRSEHFFTSAAHHQSSNQAALWGLGVLFLTQGDKKRVQTIWKNNVVTVDTMLLSGLYKEQERKWDEALLWYEIAAAFDLSKSALPLGRLLNQERKYVEAIPIWQAALEKYPDHPSRKNWVYGLVDSFEGSQQWEQVLLTSGAALSQFPDDSLLLSSLGKAQYYYLGDENRAINTIKNAIMINPNFAKAYAAIGAIMTREENLDEAFNWYSQAIERDPNVRRWYVSKANVARKAGDLDVAMKLLEEAIILDPDYAPPHYEISWLFKQWGETEQAIDAIENAINLHSSPPANYYLRAGQVYEWADQFEKAVAAYQQAAILAPNDQRILDALVRVQDQ